MADCIVLDWKGLEEDGKAVKFSKEECVRVLKEYKDFRDHVSELANSMEIFRQEMDAEAEKNLKKS
jgi:archaellum component FlaC